MYLKIFFYIIIIINVKNKSKFVINLIRNLKKGEYGLFKLLNIFIKYIIQEYYG